MARRIKAFIGAPMCIEGKDICYPFYVNLDDGLIVRHLGPEEEPVETVDVKGCFIAPSFLELQTNGCLGVHFTNYKDSQTYQANLRNISRHLVTQGVGSFYVTLPTVIPEIFKKVVPELKPQIFTGAADLLGAHCEGPWLNPSKKGAHDESLMQIPARSTPEGIYGNPQALAAIKLVTLAPELEGSMQLIEAFTKQHGIVVSLGHSCSDFDTGISGLAAGARTLTHVFNAMNPLHHRNPGLAGLISSSKAPFYSLIADGIHLHPATLTMAFRANPKRCILITDSIEMAGMPDGVYPGHAQIPHPQRKQGNKITIDGTDTLIGSCSSIDECIRNLKKWSGCSLPEAVRCASENIVELMGIPDRGKLEEGRRADFVILDPQGTVLQTWKKGVLVFERK